jgi:hypothetical protein
LPYLVFYSAFDAVVGLSNGLVVKYGSELPSAEQAVLRGVSDALANLIHQPVPLTIYLIGTLSSAVAVIAAAVALSQAGARRTATIPLGLARFGGGPRYRFLSDADAIEWLRRNRYEDRIQQYLPELADERGPGRPEIGARVQVCLGHLLPAVDSYAADHRCSRAEAVRLLVIAGLGNDA